MGSPCTTQVLGPARAVCLSGVAVLGRRCGRGRALSEGTFLCVCRPGPTGRSPFLGCRRLGSRENKIFVMLLCCGGFAAFTPLGGGAFEAAGPRRRKAELFKIEFLCVFHIIFSPRAPRRQQLRDCKIELWESRIIETPRFCGGLLLLLVVAAPCCCCCCCCCCC